MMVISVQFKDKNKVFKGCTYDYLLNKDEDTPKKNSIIRMMDSEYNYICNGTRVKVIGTRQSKPEDKDLFEIKYVNSDLND